MSGFEYSIISEIKKSDKSNVYLASVTGHEYPVIVKEIRHGNIQVFEALKGIDSEYLPKIYHVEETEDGLLVVEEYVDGELLAGHLVLRKMTEEECLDIAEQICDALEVLHSHEPTLIHRDIKPSNLIITPKGKVKLIDYDSSRLYKEGSEGDTRLLGTEKYAPPEQYGFSQTDCRSDIYSLGVVFEKFTDFLSECKQKLWKQLVEKCTLFSPDSRYQSVSEVRCQIERIRKSDRAKYMKITAISAIFLVLCVPVIIYLAIRNDGQSTTLLHGTTQSTEEQTSETSITDLETTEISTTETTTTEILTTEASTMDYSITEVSTTEVPTMETLVTEMPTTETTTTETPTTETTTTETPTTEAPTTEAPTTEAPTTEAPTTEAPTTEAPTTEAPTTEAPTTEASTTEAPTTKVPTTETPTTETPTTEKSTTQHIEETSSNVINDSIPLAPSSTTVGTPILPSKLYEIKSSGVKNSITKSSECRNLEIGIRNNGSSTIRIFPNATITVTGTSEYNRDLRLINAYGNALSYTDIPAGSTAYVRFHVIGDNTLFSTQEDDGITEVHFDFYYGNTLYNGTAIAGVSGIKCTVK